MNRLDGKVALISGAAKGQGSEEVLLFASEGAQVIFGDILDDLGVEVEKEVIASGGKAKYIHLDVTNAQDWEEAIAFAESEYGKLDILVNNAGIALRQDYLDVSSEDWDRTMEINSKGVFLGTKYAIPAMRRAGGGSIVNISSIAGIVGVGSSIAYCASKAAVISLTKSMAISQAPDIRVNAVAPGVAHTRWIAGQEEFVKSAIETTPLKRIATAKDVANAIFGLAIGEFITGQVLVVDGGRIL